MNVKWFALPITMTLAACSSEAKPEPRAAVAPVVRETPPPPPPPAPTKRETALTVSESIRSACALPEPQTHFAYNSSKVRQEDQSFLKRLTNCFASGPLSKRRLRLVGHADPRGSDQFNFALARDRAESVKVAMLQLGLSQQQAMTESRGKLDATGTNEAGWARDRRVEVSLLD
jgi:peptidoglycan-associated lipoprotein